MRTKYITIFLVIFALFLGLLGYVMYKDGSFTKKSVITPTSTSTSTTKPKTADPVISNYYFPINDFDNRIKYRWFGKYVDGTDTIPDCGAIFVGYHNADDLEVTSAEKSIDMPVYAVADGIIRQVSNVSGYGGLLVMGANIQGQDVTINYGHVRLSSITLKSGDTVKAGQKLGVLGTGCSAETAGERKHLHFAIHKGTTVNVRGYLPNQSELNDWIDPATFLRSLKPNQPK